EAALDPALSIFFRVDENYVELAVKPVHVAPRHAFEEAVFGKNADVLRKIGVINAARLQVEHLGCKQTCESDRPWSADNNLGKFFPLNVIKDSKNRRKAQLLQLVFRQLEFTNWLEILDWDVVDAQLAARNDHD